MSYQNSDLNFRAKENSEKESNHKRSTKLAAEGLKTDLISSLLFTAAVLGIWGLFKKLK